MPSRAEIAAQDVLSKFYSGEPPVQVEEIARKCGAQVVYQPFDGQLSGMLYRADDQTVIGVNASHPPARKRFTVAHELGHLMLHKGRAVWVDRLVRVDFRDPDSATATRPEEIQANTFAAELLMPRRQLIADATARIRKEVDRDLDEFLRWLARRYGVSQQAMGYRLVNLGIIDPEPGHAD
jgi:Zn-dependent peptidase ImmA (M78 family)